MTASSINGYSMIHGTVSDVPYPLLMVMRMRRGRILRMLLYCSAVLVVWMLATDQANRKCQSKGDTYQHLATNTKSHMPSEQQVIPLADQGSPRTETPIAASATARAKTSAEVSCSLDELLKGKWVRTEAMPEAALKGYSLCQVDRRQECWKVVNGTVQGPDEWLRWQPDSSQCQIAPLQPSAVKQCLRGKNIIFIGDSLSRNQQQSLQCLLMEEQEPPRQYREGYKLEYNSSYPDYNMTIKFIISDFLYGWLPEVQANDIVVVGTGPHWLNPKRPGFNTARWDENTTAGAAMIDERIKSVVSGLLQTFARAERIIWRLPDVSHFEKHDIQSIAQARGIFSGGTDQLACVPWKDWDPASQKVPLLTDQWIYDSVRKHTQGTRIELFDVLALSGSRPEAHPGWHRMKYANKMVHDCLHWCLPGVPDMWNEILMSHLCGNGV